MRLRRQLAVPIVGERVGAASRVDLPLQAAGGVVRPRSIGVEVVETVEGVAVGELVLDGGEPVARGVRVTRRGAVGEEILDRLAIPVELRGRVLEEGVDDFRCPPFRVLPELIDADPVDGGSFLPGQWSGRSKAYEP